MRLIPELVKYSTMLLAAIALHGCGSSTQYEVDTVEISEESFSISLYASGELKASESTPIKPPPGSRNPRTIAWMAPNFSWVQAGEVIARFEDGDARMNADAAEVDLSVVDIQVFAKQRELDLLLTELSNEMDLVDIEKVMADRFAVENNLAYSRHEIIDAMRNKALLEYKSGHLENKKVDYSDKQGAEIAVLNAKKESHQAKYQEYQGQIDKSSVQAPHDGFLVYEKSWWGQPVSIGSTVFPGNKIASIPKLEKMQAELQVVETEAVGLSVGQKVELYIDAFPDQLLDGEISHISATASPIERDNPVKYFMVTVDINQSDPEWITPGAQVEAEIFINQVPSALVIPNQALFQESGSDWVYVKESGDLEQRRVELGVRGPNRSQVIGGLETGDLVALHLPEDTGND